jgi:uncharacterized protein (DUF1800 family)
MSRTRIGVLSFCLWIGLVMPGGAAPADPKVLHLLNRLSLGVRPGDVQKVEAIGVEAYIQQQLAPEQIPEPQSLGDRLSQLASLKLSPGELAQQFRQQQQERKQFKGQPSQPSQPSQIQLAPPAQQRLRQTVAQQAAAARLLRATQSDRQLQEVMVDFWYNHFNVFAGKGLDRVLIGSYEAAAIRPHTLGRFRDLLGATAKHPAMLFYLDNWQNTAPNSPGARGRFTGLNENYARELMELHTLGVEGGYSQQDVIALAKILTGWGLQRGKSGNSSGFYFDPQRHDASDKVFLGQTIQGGGMEEGEKALDILARQPATAKHISYKLAQYFVADRPPQSLVDRLSERYLTQVAG